MSKVTVGCFSEDCLVALTIFMAGCFKVDLQVWPGADAGSGVGALLDETEANELAALAEAENLDLPPFNRSKARRPRRGKS